jgi:hypothetical protein
MHEAASMRKLLPFLLLPLGCAVFPPPPPPPTPTPTPSPTPTPLTCVLSGEPTTTSPDQTPSLQAVVKAVVSNVTGCVSASVCPLGDETQQHFQARIEAALQNQGLCAGQHSSGTDEIAVAQKCSDPWEGYDVFAGDDSEGPVPPGGVARTVRWAVYKGSWQPPAGACK